MYEGVGQISEAESLLVEERSEHGRAIDRLCDRLPPERVAEVRKVEPVALRLIEKIGPKGEAVDFEKPTAQERVFLMLSVAKRWQQAGDNLVEQKRLSRVMSMLYRQPDRDRMIVDTLGQEFNLQPGVMGLLVADAFPECWKAVDWSDYQVDGDTNGQKMASLDDMGRKAVEKQIAEYARDNLAKNDLLVIPREETTGVKRERVYKQLDIPKENWYKYAGFAFFDTKLAVVFEFFNKLEKTLAPHELNHVRNQGFRVGGLGVGLDEGMTDLMAYRQTYGNLSGLQRELLERIAPYRAEIALIKAMFRQGDELQKMMMDRYHQPRWEKGDIDVSTSLAAKLIGDYGLDGYLDLYLEDPYAKNFQKQLGERSYVLTSRQVRERLRLV